MLIIGNGLNGQYLKNALVRAPEGIEWVKAAVAYASGSPELIDYCTERGIPLYFWGRMDESFPVTANILQRFLKLGPNYHCKLVWKHYHPKVIWFSGYGAYIGSANLTENGWVNNIECGVWFTQTELEKHNLISEMESIFDEIDKYAEPLTDELFNKLKELESRYSNIRSELSVQQKNLSDAFTTSVIPLLGKNFQGLARVVSRKDAGEARKLYFLQEWAETLQLLRKISEEVILDENRPAWVHASIPKGVQVDQFLHAFYYHKVMQGVRSRHEEFHNNNKTNPQNTLKEVMSWWKSTDKENFRDEHEFMYERAPFLLDHLSSEKLSKLSENEFVQICRRIHAFVTSARQTSNSDLGLPEETHLDLYARAEFVARWIWNQRSGNGSDAPKVLYHVLYGGPSEDITERIWEASFTEAWHLPRFGLGSIGEIVGWAMPDRFPPRNGRTSKALSALGYTVKLWSQ